MKCSLWFCFFVLCGVLNATPGLNHGLGGQSSARLGSVTAEEQNPYGALYNPALMGAQKESQFAFSSTGASYNFSNLNDVVVDSPQYRTQTGRSRQTGSYQFNPPSYAQWSVGFTHPFSLPKSVNRRAGIGFALSGPFDTLRRFRSETPYQFQALRYATTDNQFRAATSLSVEVLRDRLFAGIGTSFYIGISGDADAQLMTENPTGRLYLDVGLNSTVLAGLYARLGTNSGASLVYRQAMKPVLRQRVTGMAEVGNGVPTIDLPLLIQSTLYFEPETIELEYQTRWQTLTASAGLSWQHWAAFESPFTRISTTSRDGQEHHTQIPGLRLKSTWNPRVSLGWQFSKKTQLCGGYRFRPSPVPSEDLAGPTNLLDSPTHALSLGIAYTFSPSAWAPFPTKLTAFSQAHLLSNRSVTKANEDMIGAPGYQFGGQVYYYGLALEAVL